ncbi:MAG: Rid family hydrolase, partial [Novosphingobium sp.]
EARARFERVTATGRANTQIWMLLALACRALDDGAGEETAIDAALALDPGLIRGQVMKGDCRVRAGDEQGALEFYQAALRWAEGMELPADLAAEIERARAVVAGAAPAGADPVEHYARTFERIGAILARAGSSWDDVLDITTFHTDIDASLTPLAAAKNRYVKAPFPTWTAIGIRRLYEPSAVVEIKVVARLTAKAKGKR